MIRNIFCIILFCLTCTAGVAREMEGKTWYDFGMFAYEEKQLDAAMGYAQKALESEPDQPLYIHLLGKILLAKGDHEKAASVLEPLLGIEAEPLGLKYDLALCRFSAEKFEESADLFAAAVNEDPSNVLARYYAGISHFKTERYEKALNYLRSSMERSTSIGLNGSYYAGVCAYKTGRFRDARKMLELVKNESEPGPMKENARKWLSIIDKKIAEQKSIHLFLRLTAGYDDNVSLDPPERSYYAGEGEEEDLFGSLFFSGAWDFLQRNAFLSGIRFSHYQSFYKDVDEFNLMADILDLYARYRVRDFDFGITYKPSAYRVDGDSYLVSHRIIPEAGWRVRENMKAGISLQYTMDDYENDEGKDCDTKGLFFTFNHKPGYREAVWFSEIGYEDSRADDFVHDYRIIEGMIGLKMDIVGDLTMTLKGGLSDKEYDEEDPILKKTRKDTRYNGQVSLEKPVFRDILKVSGGYGYTKNHSNMEDFDYKRHLFSLSLTATY